MIKCIKPQELSDKEKLDFANHFYSLWPSDNNDLESSFPWGLPWLWSKMELNGETIEEMAENFFYYHEKVILECMNEEIENLES